MRTEVRTIEPEKADLPEIKLIKFEKNWKMTILTQVQQVEIKYPSSDGDAIAESDITRDYIAYSIAAIAILNDFLCIWQFLQES